MIKTGKTLQFYFWDFEDKEVQVVGEKAPGNGGFHFKLFFDRKELDDPDGKILSQFVKELYDQRKS